MRGFHSSALIDTVQHPPHTSTPGQNRHRVCPRQRGHGELPLLQRWKLAYRWIADVRGMQFDQSLFPKLLDVVRHGSKREVMALGDFEESCRPVEVTRQAVHQVVPAPLHVGDRATLLLGGIPE